MAELHKKKNSTTFAWRASQ